MTSSNRGENHRACPNLQLATLLGCGKLASWEGDTNSRVRQVGYRQVGKLRRINDLQPHIGMQLAGPFPTCQSTGKLATKKRSIRHDKLSAYDAQNRLAARLILADPERFGGPEAGLVRWARLVVERQTSEQEQGELFERKAS